MAIIVNPHNINLASSNVTASALSEYNSGTAYTAGQQVKVSFESDGTTPRTPVYEYEAVGGTTGNYPPTDDGTNWTLIGASNKWKMFDSYVSSQTENADTIEIELTVTKADKLYLLNVQADEIRVVCKESDLTPISDETIAMSDTSSGSWSEYFFGDFEFKTVLAYDLPGYYTNMSVTITIDKTGGTAKCGHCVIGKKIEIGTTEYGISVGIQDYSVKETNDFGETTFLERAFAKVIDADLFIQHDTTGSEYDRIQRVLSSIRATPCVYDFNNNGISTGSFVAFGFFKDFDLVARYATITHCSLSIEGLI